MEIKHYIFQHTVHTCRLIIQIFSLQALKSDFDVNIHTAMSPFFSTRVEGV
jgi:hypothetical protein